MKWDFDEIIMMITAAAIGFVAMILLLIQLDGDFDRQSMQIEAANAMFSGMPLHTR